MSGDRRWLIIPIEVQVREFVAKLLVAAIAADRGYDVLFGHDRVVRRLARFLPKGILFDKALGVSTDRKVRRYARLGFKLTALDEESTGLYPNPDMFFSTRLSPEMLALAERWFTISDIIRDLTVERFPEHAAKFVTTGLPRADIWRPPFHGLYEAERSAIAAAHRPFILFNSNFGTVVHARRGEFVERQQQRHEKHYAGATAYLKRVETEGGRNLDAFLEMLPRLREWFPDRKVIVRPHPSEDHAFWQAAVAKVPGVEIHGTGIVTPWILAADCLVHHGCTTGIEAGLLGKPHVMYAPHPDHHHDTDIMATFAPIVHDLDALRAVIGDILADPARHQKPRQSLEKYYASLVGPLVAERIVDEFDKLPLAGGRLPPWLPALRFGPRHLVAEHWPRSRQASAYARQKWYGTSLAEMRDKLAIMARPAGLAHPIRADEVFPQLFHLRRA